MNEEVKAKSPSFWGKKWDKMHHMPSWTGGKFTREEYVRFCVNEYRGK